MAQSTYLAKQLSGPLAQATISTVQAQYALSDPIISYWYGLSIDTSSDADLVGIGYLVGLPWPSAPSGYFSSVSFLLGSASLYPKASPTGLSGTSLPQGGILASDSSGSTVLIPSGSYKILLKAYAYMKYYGLNWVSIDKIASSFGTLNYSYRASNANQLTLGTSASYPTVDTLHGLSGISVTTGGYLSSVNPSYFPASDIIISYATPISLASLWILQSLFSNVCTAPQIFVRNGA